LPNIDACWRAAKYLFVGQIYLKANPLLEVPLNTSLSSRDCRDIEGRRQVSTAVACSSTRSINAFDLNMIYIIDLGYQKLAIGGHQTAVRTVSVFLGGD
jgi:xylulose-5-phosphate/fructose-6-phosphate phosphoketolase